MVSGCYKRLLTDGALHQLTLDPSEDRADAAHPQGRYNIGETHPGRKVGRGREDLVNGAAIEARVDDAGEALRRRRLVRCGEKEVDYIALEFGLYEQWRLTFVDTLKLYTLQALGEVRQIARVFEQQVESLGAIDLGELVDDRLQTGRESSAHRV